MLALLGQCPGRTGAAPVAALVIQHHGVTQTRLAPQHLFGRPDIAKVDAWQAGQMGLPALEAGFIRQRACGEDYGVGWVVCDIVGVEKRVQAQGDAQFCKLPLVPIHQVQDLGAAGLHSSQTELAADDRQSLNDFNVVTAFGGGAGGFQTCGTSTDD